MSTLKSVPKSVTSMGILRRRASIMEQVYWSQESCPLLMIWIPVWGLYSGHTKHEWEGKRLPAAKKVIPKKDSHAPLREFVKILDEELMY